MKKFKLQRVTSIGLLVAVAASCTLGAMSAISTGEYESQAITSTYMQESTIYSTSQFSTTSYTTSKLCTTAASTTSTTESILATYTTVDIDTTRAAITTECKSVPIETTADVSATFIESIFTEYMGSSETVTATKPQVISLTDSEKYLLATLVTLESGAESYECQKAVASTVINRMLTSGSSLNSVIYAKGQYSVAGRLSYSKPFEVSVEAVNDVLCNGTTLPIYVTYFRAGRYHSWGDQVAYTCIDNTYFSYSAALRNQY